jgi:hypothetical protein
MAVCRVHCCVQLLCTLLCAVVVYTVVCSCRVQLLCASVVYVVCSCCVHLLCALSCAAVVCICRVQLLCALSCAAVVCICCVHCCVQLFTFGAHLARRIYFWPFILRVSTLKRLTLRHAHITVCLIRYNRHFRRLPNHNYKLSPPNGQRESSYVQNLISETFW